MTSARITGAAPGEGAHPLEPPPSRTLFPAQRGPSPPVEKGEGPLCILSVRPRASMMRHRRFAYLPKEKSPLLLIGLAPDGRYPIASGVDHLPQRLFIDLLLCEDDGLIFAVGCAHLFDIKRLPDRSLMCDSHMEQAHTFDLQGHFRHILDLLLILSVLRTAQLVDTNRIITRSPAGDKRSG